MSNQSFKGLSRGFQTFSSITSTRNSLLNYLKVKNKSEFDNTLTINNGSLIIKGNLSISSRNITTSEGFTIGRTPVKDMGDRNYTYEFDPNDYQSQFFPGMADFIDSNIIAGDKSEENRLIASYWRDLGNDVFDDWGFFYLYDVDSGRYYFPLISPQDQDDGVITTQTFNAFGRNFTITHGWSVQGIFKFDISVDDDKLFRFGAYGNMGSDGDEVLEQLTESYSLDGNSLTLYYHHHQESGDSIEQLYSYFIPKNISENNNTQSYNAYYYSDDMSILSKEVKSGLIVYFSKSYDVKEWVINDLEITSGSGTTLSNIFVVDGNGNEFVAGNILSKGTNLGKMTFTSSINDSDYTASASSLINGYFTSSNLNDNRLFIIPSSNDIISAIPNCSVNTSFRFTINNVQSGSYSRSLSTTDASVTIDSSCINNSVPQNIIITYVVIITNITSGSESAIILQDCNSELF